MLAIDLAGKPIAITGASSGIGAATAIACAAAGMPVALGARRADKLESLVSRITSSGGRAIAVPMDVCKPDDSRRLVERTVEAFGSIYAVYANAGYGEECAVADMADEGLRLMFETNFFGTLSTIRAALPFLSKNPPGPTGVRGHILICSSCVARIFLPYYSAYTASKAAQSHIGRAMNLELRGVGVPVSTVHPIGTKTEFFDVVQRRAKGRTLLALHTPSSMLQSAEAVAERTVACLRRPRSEVWVGAKGATIRTLMSVANMVPGVTDWFLGRALDKLQRQGMPEGERVVLASPRPTQPHP